jgi:hypothetical protein
VTGEKEERLAIIATGFNTEQILNIPDLPAGTGLEISSAVYESLDKYGILNRVEAFSFDTTASNTGRFKGACALLERRVGRDILFLGCRHHILEIILAAVFSTMGSSKGPESILFKEFKNCWPQIDQQKFTVGLVDPRINAIIGNESSEILNYANVKILEEFPRNDYKEFLELIIIFLGGTPPRGLKFSKPGPIHSARWMAKAIYTLKMLMFRNQFSKLDAESEKQLVEVGGFIVKCYASFWFEASKAAMAPLNDIELLKKLVKYRNINAEIAEISIKKFLNHLYYLNTETVGLALFDPRLPHETKTKMVNKINADLEMEEEECEGEILEEKKLQVKRGNLEEFLDREISTIFEELMAGRTKNILRRFKIKDDFWSVPTNQWDECADYVEGQEKIKQLKVVNDSAERGVRLLEEYNQSITKDEIQKQYVFKVSSLFQNNHFNFFFLL